MWFLIGLMFVLVTGLMLAFGVLVVLGVITGVIIVICLLLWAIEVFDPVDPFDDDDIRGI